MIDLHSHLLPGLDDGARTLDEALGLARIAVADGISRSVLTPHIHPGRYDNDLRSIREAFDQLEGALERHRIPLEIGMAAEVRISMEMLTLIDQGRIPFLGVEGDFSILLLEFPHSHILPGTEKMVSVLLERGIRPMIAHPERNKDVIRRLDKIEPFVRAGCMLQVTAGSVAGDFGPLARQRAIEMLERGWVEVLASHAHNAEFRPPRLEPGRAAAARVVGEAASWRLVRERPAELSRSLFAAGTGGSQRP